MAQFFDSILGFIETTWSILLNIFGSLEFSIQAITTAIAVPFSISAFVPAILAGSIFIVSAIGVVKFIFGR